MHKHVTSFGIDKLKDKIKEDCQELTYQVRSATEQAIMKINSFNDEFIFKIDKFENDTISSLNNGEANKKVKDLE